MADTEAASGPPQQQTPTTLPWYEQEWFVIVVIIVVLFILFLMALLIVRRCGPSQPNIRQRMPLPFPGDKPPHQHLFLVHPPGGDILDDGMRSPTSTRPQSRSSLMVQGPGVGVVNPAFQTPSPPTRPVFRTGVRTDSSGSDPDHDHWTPRHSPLQQRAGGRNDGNDAVDDDDEGSSVVDGGGERRIQQRDKQRADSYRVDLDYDDVSNSEQTKDKDTKVSQPGGHFTHRTVIFPATHL